MAEAKKKYKYLVVKHWEDDPADEFECEIMTAAEIFKWADMLDCYPNVEFEISRINGIGLQPSECSFHGKWHDSSDPQKMVIVGDGIREIGYGTEH